MNNKRLDFRKNKINSHQKRIDELKKKISSPDYMNFAMEKIASDLTHLLFR